MERTLSVAISGGTDVSHYEKEAKDIANQLVQALLQHKVVLLTGANVGFPDMVSSVGQKEGLTTIRFSSEATFEAHTQSPRASTRYATALIYTGFGLTGADTILIRSADIVIIGPGAAGTIHEFAGALEEGKVVGVLTGPWHTDEVAASIAALTGAHERQAVFSDSPDHLVKALFDQII